MLALIVAALAHVPTYGSGADSCYKPPHHHTTSQVVYVRGSGGLEVHFDSTSPFDILGGEILDVDAVFRNEYDQSTYSLYIGCGGCVWSVDPIVTPPVSLNGYVNGGEVEPFTQTFYRSVFPKAERKFNTSVLRDCDQNHFTIRVVDYHNRTDGSTLVWGAVVGLGESFTFTELLSFPIFVLKNHGTWNELGWTIWVIAFFAYPLWCLDRFLARTCFKIKLLSPFDNAMRNQPRAWFCDFALVSFAVVMVEEFVHLCYAQAHAEFGYQFWVGLLGVILIANGLPMLIISTSFWSLYHPTWCIAHGAWSLPELLASLVYLFLFGAGFFLGPALAFLAASLRLLQWVVAMNDCGGDFTAYGRVPTDAPDAPDAPDASDASDASTPTGALPALFFKATSRV